MDTRTFDLCTIWLERLALMLYRSCLMDDSHLVVWSTELGSMAWAEMRPVKMAARRATSVGFNMTVMVFLCEDMLALETRPRRFSKVNEVWDLGQGWKVTGWLLWRLYRYVQICLGALQSAPT